MTAGLLLSVLAVFLPSSIDLGDIRDTDGPAVCTFVCANDSGSPLGISFVSASCSCVDVNWPKEPIAPGKSGEITAVLNPAGMAGHITRELTVWEKGDRAIATLEIKANVLSSLAPREHPLLDGKAAVTAKSVNFGYIRQGDAAVREIGLRNLTDGPLVLHVTCSGGIGSSGDSTVEPGESTFIPVICAPAGIGSVKGSVTISSGKSSAVIPVEALCIGETASGQVPSITTPGSPLALSVLGRCRFTVSNTGTAPLEIYRIELPEGVGCKGSAGTVEAGKSTVLTIDSRLKDFRIRIFSNDPGRPCRELEFIKYQ